MYDGPRAIAYYRDKKAYAYLGINFEAPYGNRDTIICGEEYPDIKEVEIYYII